MDSLLVYLIEVSVCLGVTLLIYRVILSELTFFAVNRAVLLLLLASSFTIPLLSFQVFGIGGADVVREMTLPAFQVGEQETLPAAQAPIWLRMVVSGSRRLLRSLVH